MSFDDTPLRNIFVAAISYLLRDYDKHTSFLSHRIPVFNLVGCLDNKPAEYKEFYYHYFSTQMFYYFLQEQDESEMCVFFDVYKKCRKKLNPLDGVLYLSKVNNDSSQLSSTSKRSLNDSSQSSLSECSPTLPPASKTILVAPPLDDSGINEGCHTPQMKNIISISKLSTQSKGILVPINLAEFDFKKTFPSLSKSIESLPRLLEVPLLALESKKSKKQSSLFSERDNNFIKDENEIKRYSDRVLMNTGLGKLEDIGKMDKG